MKKFLISYLAVVLSAAVIFTGICDKVSAVYDELFDYISDYEIQDNDSYVNSAAAVSKSDFLKSVKVNSAPGKKVYKNNNAVIDYSNAAYGYVMVKYPLGAKRIKVQIVYGSKTYNYDLNKKNVYEAYPLQLGEGTYRVRVMENISGTTYRQIASVYVDVDYKSAFYPFMYPNQYAAYDKNSDVVAKSYALCKNYTKDIDKVKAVYQWVTKNITYDKKKAQTVKSGYLPDVDEILKSKKGICFDYASLVTAMLRAQNIPVKLVVGTVAPNDLNHAWNEIYIKNKGWITVKLYMNTKWNRVDATFGTSSSSSIAEFIGDGSNYTTLRIY